MHVDAYLSSCFRGGRELFLYGGDVQPLADLTIGPGNRFLERITRHWQASGADWLRSSFQRHVRMGYYERDWGEAVENKVKGKRIGE
jgi:hypothetical protein